jgi:cytochrome c peroxidase
MKKSASFLRTGLISGLFLTVVLVSCKKHKVQLMSDSPNLSGNNYEYLNVSIPGQNMNIGDMIKDGSAQNGISNKSVTLGRVLFYDKKLSINNSVSCGSCHQQSLAFSDNVDFSTGFGNLFTTRNSMSIQNPVFNNNMFWDSRAKSPKELSMMPVFNHIEMGMETDQMLVTKLSATSYYPHLFQEAYGDEGITRERISLAISQFVNCLFSMNSKFDKSQADSFRNFTPMESFGMELFFSEKLKCSQCHSGTNFSAPDFVGGGYGGGSTSNDNPRGTANIGLDLVYKDNGRGQGKFKIPSLRNIELTGPYMHDGRFRTLNDVLEHYSHGIQDHPNLDNKFRENGKPVKFNFSENEKYALISFLKTLTDYSLISDPKFSDPFKNN